MGSRVTRHPRMGAVEEPKVADREPGGWPRSELSQRGCPNISLLSVQFHDILYTLSADILYTFALFRGEFVGGVFGDGVEVDGDQGAAGSFCGGSRLGNEAVRGVVRGVRDISSDRLSLAEAVS